MENSLGINQEKIDAALLCWKHSAGSGYNCWGFVAAYFGWIDSFRWLTAASLEEFLSTCQPVDQLQIGDIIAYYSNEGWLVHTALYAGDGYCYHKRGSNAFEYIKTIDVREIYAEYGLKEEVLLRVA